MRAADLLEASMRSATLSAWARSSLLLRKARFGKFARLRHACAQFEATRKQHVHYDGAAVSLQLNHIFTSKAGWRGEVEQDAVVYRLPVAAEKVGVKRGARLGRFAAD